jgi:hypothetical protein
MQKSTGVYELAVWNEPIIWDNSTMTQITPAAVSVTVSFGQRFSTVNVYDPMTGTSPVSTLSRASTATISLVDHPLVLELVP